MGFFGARTVPSARVYNAAAISVASDGAFHGLTFDSERWDTDGIHSVASNTDRLTCATPGLYRGLANVTFASNATGYRGVRVRLNGATTIAEANGNAVNGNTHRVSLPFEYQLVAGDYVTVEVFQNSGGALDVTVVANASPEFGMTWQGHGT